MVHVIMCLQQINVVYLLRMSTDVCSVIRIDGAENEMAYFVNPT